MSNGEHVGGDGSYMSQKCFFSCFYYYGLTVYLSFEIESIVLITFVCRMLAWTMHMLASDGFSYVITRLLQGLVRFKFKDVHLALQLSSSMVMAYAL